MFAFEFLFLLGFPLVLACGATCLAWGALSRPVVFLGVATVVLYLQYAVLSWLLNPGPIGYALTMRQAGEATASEPLFLLIPSYKILLVTFTVGAVLALAVLLRVFKKGRTGEA